MTYKELSNLILSLSTEQQNSDVSIYDDYEDEYYPMQDYGFCKDDVLDNEHFYIVF